MCTPTSSYVMRGMEPSAVRLLGESLSPAGLSQRPIVPRSRTAHTGPSREVVLKASFPPQVAGTLPGSLGILDDGKGPAPDRKESRPGPRSLSFFLLFSKGSVTAPSSEGIRQLTTTFRDWKFLLAAGLTPSGDVPLTHRNPGL